MPLYSKASLELYSNWCYVWWIKMWNFEKWVKLLLRMWCNIPHPFLILRLLDLHKTTPSTCKMIFWGFSGSSINLFPFLSLFFLFPFLKCNYSVSWRTPLCVCVYLIKFHYIRVSENSLILAKFVCKSVFFKSCVFCFKKNVFRHFRRHQERQLWQQLSDMMF